MVGGGGGEGGGGEGAGGGGGANKCDNTQLVCMYMCVCMSDCEAPITIVYWLLNVSTVIIWHQCIVLLIINI